MTNPLLKPDDPRFRQPEMRDAEGKNVFAESAQGAADAASSGDPYAAGGSEERPYLPQYGAQQQSRYALLLLLSGLGWFAAAFSAASFIGVWTSGWLSPLIGCAPAAAAWLLAYEELKAASAGAIDATATPPLRIAFWLGLTGLLACAGIVGSMIYLGMNFLPDLF